MFPPFFMRLLFKISFIYLAVLQVASPVAPVPIGTIRDLTSVQLNIIWLSAFVRYGIVPCVTPLYRRNIRQQLYSTKQCLAFTGTFVHQSLMQWGTFMIQQIAIVIAGLALPYAKPGEAISSSLPLSPNCK